MKKLLITAMLAAVCGGVNAQVVNPDSIIDGNWLSFYVRYPKEAKKHKVEGRVIITFVVEGDGSISNVEPVQSLVHFVNKEKALKATGMTEEEMTNHFGNLFQDEARRVLNSMPNWKPGVQFGRPVRVKYTMPLNFAQP